jgi:hypothetical protein
MLKITRKVSEYTRALKIAGTDLKPVEFAEVTEPVRADAKGTLTLSADTAELHGDQIRHGFDQKRFVGCTAGKRISPAS